MDLSRFYKHTRSSGAKRGVTILLLGLTQLINLYLGRNAVMGTGFPPPVSTIEFVWSDVKALRSMKRDTIFATKVRKS